MGSLQDELLKAGLVSKRDAGRRRKRKRKKARRQTGETGTEMSLAQAYAARERAEESERARARNRRLEEERRRRAINARLTELVLPAAKNTDDAEIARYFEHNGKIRRIHVTPDQQTQLADGRLGIVYLRGRYYLVEAGIVAQVREIKPEAVAWFAPSQDDDSGSEDDDAYADERFRVPDDLTW